MTGCFHCSSEFGACECQLCGSQTLKGWKAGVCRACVGRAKAEAYAHITDKFDPRKSELWVRIPAHDGTPAKRQYLPLKGLQ